MSVSRSLPAQRVASPALARPRAAYDFDVIADLPPEPDMAAIEPEPDSTAVEQTPLQDSSRTA